MPDSIDFHTLKFTFEKKFMTVACTDGRKLQLDGTLGETIVGSGGFSSDLRSADHLELDWSAGRLNVHHTQYDRRLRRYTFEWQSAKQKKMKDTWNMKGAHWYGGAAFGGLQWPLEKNHRKLLPFITGDSNELYSGVQERYFLSSKGIALFVDPDVPLYAGINRLVQKKDSFEFIFQADFAGAYENPDKQKLFLNYSIFQGPDIFKVHECAIQHVIDKPNDIPCEMLFEKPCWTTFGVLPKNKLTKAKTLEFVDDLVDNDVPVAAVEIAEHWATHHGDFEFNAKRLPDAAELFQRIQNHGILSQIWTHPFAGNNSATQKQKIPWVDASLPNDYVKYPHGLGKLYDFTSDISVQTFHASLEKFKEEYGMSSFSFDFGHSNYLPADIGVSDKTATCPNVYATKYAEMAAAADTEHRAQTVEIGVRTQHLPMFVRMRRHGSSWTELSTVIPHALTFSIIGFPFVVADAAGGTITKGLPDAELYTRWVQATCLMPGMIMAYPPHLFPDDTRDAVMGALELRKKLSDVVLQLARDTCNTGLPIIRPLWFVAPRDDNALTVDSQFMVGRDIIVAPVLEQGVTSRQVYLPPGQWKDEVHDEVLVGGKWHYNVSADLGDLLYFTRYPPPTTAAPEEPEQPEEEEGEEGEEEGDPTESVAAKKLQQEEDGEEEEEEEEEDPPVDPVEEEEEEEEEEEDEEA